MEPKKNFKQQTEKYSGLFRDFGIALALFLILSAFKINIKSTGKLPTPPTIDIDEDFVFTVPTRTPLKKIDNTVEKVVKKSAVKKIVIAKKPIKKSEKLPELVFDPNIAIDSTLFYKTPIVDKVIFDLWQLEEMPSFPGGETELVKFLKSNIEYPKLEHDNGIEGRVILNFVIDRKGNVADIEVMKGTTKNFEEEAIRVLGKMPRWKPGKQMGKAVKCRFYIPIVYRL